MPPRKAVTGAVVGAATNDVVEGQAVTPREIRQLDLSTGKPVKFLAPTDGQIAVISKDSKAAERDPEKVVTLMWTYFRIIELLLLDPDDGRRIEDALLDGSLSLADLTSAVYGAPNVAAAPARTRRR